MNQQYNFNAIIQQNRKDMAFLVRHAILANKEMQQQAREISFLKKKAEIAQQKTEQELSDLIDLL